MRVRTFTVLAAPALAVLALAAGPTAALAQPGYAGIAEDRRACGIAITHVIQETRAEVAMMRAMAAQARSDGHNDLAAAYDRIAGEHAARVEEEIRILATYGYPAPPEAAPAAESHPADLEHAIAMHREIAERHRHAAGTESCATARRLELTLALCSARHVSELEALVPPSPVAAAGPPVVYYMDRVVERVVERPVERVVERVVEKPVERVVERVVVRTVTRPQRVPHRRPAN